MVQSRPKLIFTIGHSNHHYQDFIRLLRPHGIQTLVDVRTNPRSRFPHFKRAFLENALPKDQIDYLFLGDELGGHPNAEDQYDSEGHALYERLSKTKEFERGIKKLLDIYTETQLVLMFTEWSPLTCHRHPFLSRVLLERSVRVVHLHRDGSSQDASDLFAKNSFAPPQLPLMELPGEDLTWRSPKKIR